jgi:hypothetical protein
MTTEDNTKIRNRERNKEITEGGIGKKKWKTKVGYGKRKWEEPKME